ncbi:MAG TPA: hypothetical protein VGO50_10195 [Pyrinomonadaceae bacterium]|jgi:hypothetical protein|nr:hypothetical protein [Pyrinomonadaceae bacterium]
MKRSEIKLGLMVGVMGLLLVLTGQISAQTNNSDRQVSESLRRLQGQMATFRYDLLEMMKRVRIRMPQGDDINKSMEDLEDAVSNFNNDFRAKRESSDGVNNILQEAQDVEVFLRAVSFGDPVADDWSKVRSTLDQLASSYKVTWDWGGGTASTGYDTQLPTQPVSQNNAQSSGGYRAGLSGAYRLDAGASDNAREVADRAVLIIGARDRDRVKADLEDKLTPPETLTLDVRGQQVTLTSSKGGQFNFTADGVDKYESGAGGRNMRVRATLRGDRLTVIKTGESDDDHTVIFESVDNGSRLRVTRRVNYATLSQTVIAESLYNKTSDLAQNGAQNGPPNGVQNGGQNSPADNPGTYSDSNPGANSGNVPTGNAPGGNNYPNQNPNSNQYPTAGAGRQGDFIVPSGTVITAKLENEVSTKASQNNDRFRMTVQAPNEFRGAVIEGYISGIKRSGKINGRAQLTFNFERIRLANGATYEFAGFLQSITDMNGETVKIDTEGVAKGDSQTKETAKRGGVGAAIGAVIGGVIGGVKGAVIGATIGGSAGAGSVYVQGRDDLELKPGSTIVLQSTGPTGNR